MPDSEVERLHALTELGVLDTPAEPRFDRIVALAADLLDAPMAAISLVDRQRQWFKASLGLEPRETPRSWSFCDHALRMGAGSTFVVTDAQTDERFSDNPLVTGAPHVRFYAGAVVTGPSGHALGALCVLDDKPRQAPDEQALRRLSHLAALVGDELELSRVRRASMERSALLDMAEAMSGVGHWRYTLEDGQVAWSDEVYRIHGVARETFDPNLGGAIGFYHEDDQATVTSAMQAVLAEGKDFSFQLRLRRADGDLRVVKAKGAAELGSAGQVMAVVGVFQDVTEQTRRLEIIERSEKRYRLLADNMADVVARMRVDGSSSYISPTITSLLGWTPAEMEGRSAQAFVHPEDQPLILQAFQRLAMGSGPQAVEHRAMHRDGRAIWVETRFTAVPGAPGQSPEIVGVIRDISERKAAALALADSEARYRFLAEHANDMIARMRPGGEIVLVTAGCRRTLGYDPAELIGRTTLELMHPDDVPMVTDYFARLGSLGPDGVLPPYQFRGRHRDGRYVWLEGQPTIFFDPDTGAPVEVQDVVRDISSRKSLELELAKARVEAETASEAKGTFLANMSHEIRTPLHGIIGYADALSLTGLDDVQAGYLSRIRRAGAGLSALVNDILDFSKLDRDRLELVEGPVDLRSLIEDVAGLTRQSVSHSLAFSTDYDPDLSDWILGDEQRIRQVLLNLLGNAAKFTTAGSVTIGVRPVEEALEIEIADTGVGIAPNALASLFESFVQADATIGRRFGGSGLGLSIARALARRMGGDITLSSVPGVGTTAIFTLPYRPAKSHAQAAFPMAAASALQGRLTVFVVDDVEANLELMRILLEGMGHAVETALDGRTALARLAEESVDLVFMDLQMPGLDGLETTRLLRASEGVNAGAPVFALSANVMADKLDAARAAGFDGHLAKPLDRNALIRVLETVSAGAASEASREPDADDPLAALKNLYRRRLGDLAGEVAGLAGEDQGVRAESLKSLAHQLAGTSGSLGFAGISQTAFRLEAALRSRKATEAEDALRDLLREAADASLEAVESTHEREPALD